MSMSVSWNAALMPVDCVTFGQEIDVLLTFCSRHKFTKITTTLQVVRKLKMQNGPTKVFGR